jgi:hypothetical protein
MSHFIKNTLNHPLILKGGYLTLQPGKWALVTSKDLDSDSVSHAIATGRLDYVEAKVKPEDDSDVGVAPLDFEGKKVVGQTEEELRAQQEAEGAKKAAEDSDQGKAPKTKASKTTKPSAPETTEPGTSQE